MDGSLGNARYFTKSLPAVFFHKIDELGSSSSWQDIFDISYPDLTHVQSILAKMVKMRVRPVKSAGYQLALKPYFLYNV
ncbi:hypothetical protein DVP95_21375, partial [Yersinia enterocolitica]|nr:hypothetical protein [Yersinia enterocolitica]